MISRKLFLNSTGVLTLASGMFFSCDIFRSRNTQLGKQIQSQLPLPKPFSLDLQMPEILLPYKSDADADYFFVNQMIGNKEIIPGYRTKIWGYNGQFPGPTILARKNKVSKVIFENNLQIPTVVHLHGGHTSAENDGYPTDKNYPQNFFPINKKVNHDPQAIITRSQRVHTYALTQPQATLWYHDHSMGKTGRNIWMGLAGFFIVNDPDTQGEGIPREDQEIPLFICDRSFDENGDFLYPKNDTEGSWMSGVLGDVILVNGVPWPKRVVRPTVYRFRILNGSNARNYELAFVTSYGKTLSITQIGSDGGFLYEPKQFDRFPISPGERFDILVDFTGIPSGQSVFLNNLRGINLIKNVLKFDIQGEKITFKTPLKVLSEYVPYVPDHVIKKRKFRFSLGTYGGINQWLINGMPFQPETFIANIPIANTEIWEISSDFEHPLHIHLNQFQVLSRNGQPPLATDSGWKDTILMRPSEIIEIIIKFSDYKGRFIMHCHNLEHEDMAMMANFAVI